MFYINYNIIKHELHGSTRFLLTKTVKFRIIRA